MEELSYTYSQLSSRSVSCLVRQNYDLPEISCEFYVLGLHDNYLIESKGEKFILRIYRNEWRSLEEIYFELELLDYLGRKNAPVAIPLLTKTGKLSFNIDSPEGERSAALFTFADGNAPGDGFSTEESVLLGSTVAKVHHATDTFESQYTRPELDIPFLLDESISKLEPFLESEAWSYIKKLQITLHNVVPVLSREKKYMGYVWVM